MKKVTLVAAALVLALTGCASKNTPSTPSTSTKPSIANPTVATVQHFSCDVGIDVTVRHLGNSQIELTTSPDVKRAVMTQAVSGSGERYVSNQGLWGNGGEWHQKGGEAYFEYVGVHGGQPKGTSCTAK